MIEEAIIFATNAHKNQTRKGSKIPYILHPMETAVIVSGMTTKEEVIIAALLHDTVEDCSHINLEAISTQFGEVVAHLVKNESEDKSKTWVERKTATIHFLNHNADTSEMMIALADKLSNMRSLVRDYKSIGDDLWNRFNMKKRETIGWYYIEVKKALYPLKDYEEYQEFSRLVEELFES